MHVNTNEQEQARETQALSNDVVPSPEHVSSDEAAVTYDPEGGGSALHTVERSLEQGHDDTHQDRPNRFHIFLPAVLPSIPMVRRSRQEIEDEPMNVDVAGQPEGPIRFEIYPIPTVRPRNSSERAHLVRMYREELVQDLVRCGIRGHRASQYYSAHRLRQLQIDQAARNEGQLNGLPLLLTDNITRHDWQKHTGDCVYTVNLGVGPRRATAEVLERHFGGVPYTIWEYWGNRIRVQEAHVTRYVNNFGPENFYRQVMWQWLNIERWLALWRAKRGSRRA